MPAKRTFRKNRAKKNKTLKKQQKMCGGASGLYDSDFLAAKYASCTSADRHNLQTSEANLALINGAGVVPPTQSGGNGVCPGNGKLMSFKDYTANVAARLGSVSSVPEPSTQTGGGYSIDPSAEQIGGQPARVGYSDCCPPVSLEGRLLMGSNSGAVCGQQAGGGKKRRIMKGNRKSSKKVKKMPIGTNNLKKVAVQYENQIGGDSVPAAFPGESHSGADGDFSDQGAQLHYDAKQPFWDATAR